ncbi:MAG: DUF1501 domain-containing protein [Aquabacterium sp.]|nr:DUF1501 domain-containing protein [Aquabacterium sp.]
MNQASRRAFMRQAAAMTSMGVAAPIGLNLSAITQAAAQSTSGGYKAVVCIFLAGGNDAFNTVLATDSASWGHYEAQRKPTDPALTSIALLPSGQVGGVLPISHAGRSVHSGRQFAIHPALKQVQQLHQDGRVAVVANVGPLTRPTSKADVADARMSKPAKLYSHNDQTSTWQSFKPEGAGAGWAGLMGDVLKSGNGAGRNSADAERIQRSFTCMTQAGASVWVSGREVMPYQSTGSSIQTLGSGNTIYGSVRLHSAAAAIMGKLKVDGSTTVAAPDKFTADHQKIVQRALQASDLISTNLAPLGTAPWSSVGVVNPSLDPLLKFTSTVDGSQKLNSLAVQLQMVARLIDTNRTANLGMTRQFFMVNLGGFDTHSNQIIEHGERMAQLNHAMAYFDTVLGAMPGGTLRSQVTTFTASEFGRTFTSNGDGTDHGWGSHHFVMGGAVNGTEVYGTFPTYSTANAQGVFSSPNQLQNGVLLPTTSVDHLAYTLGRWMGVPANILVKSDGTGILPNLHLFDSATHDLGFMKA